MEQASKRLRFVDPEIIDPALKIKKVGELGARVYCRLVNLFKECESSRAAAHAAANAAETTLTPCEYTFKDKEDCGQFLLHPAAYAPAHAVPKTGKLSGTTCISAIVTLIEAAVQTGMDRVELVNRSSDKGLMPLTLVATCPEVHLRTNLTIRLFLLGADAKQAMDGAIYFTVKYKDASYIYDLVRSLSELPTTVILPETVLKTIDHVRVDGWNAITAGISLDDVVLVRLLLRMGANTDAPKFKKHWKSCADYAASRGNAPMMHLFDLPTEQPVAAEDRHHTAFPDYQPIKACRKRKERPRSANGQFNKSIMLRMFTVGENKLDEDPK